MKNDYNPDCKEWMLMFGIKPKYFYLSSFVLVLLSVAFTVWWHHPYRLIAPFEKKWGKKKYSQYNEELFIRDFFKDKQNGYFIDVGANDYMVNSTTYYLEKHLHWHGIAIDPIKKFAEGYKANRPNTTFLAYFISDKSADTKTLYQVLSNSRISSANKGSIAGFPSKEVQVPTMTLNDILAKHPIKQIDLVSIDVELSEMEVLGGFDIDKYQPKLVVIETHGPVREKIYAYFKAHHYEAIEKYSYLDSLNSYFRRN